LHVDNVADRNVIQKEAEEQLKYKKLKHSNSANVGMKCNVILVVTEDTGNVTEGLKKIQ
jgi:hypothetical protein